MANKSTSRLSFLLFVLALFLVSASFSLAYEREDPSREDPSREDPEMYQCKHQCRAQQQFDRDQQRQCEEGCEEYIRKKREQQEQGGGEGRVIIDDRRDPRKQYEQCQEVCERQPAPHQQQCQQRCQVKYEEEKQRERGGGDEGEFLNTREKQDPQREFQECRQQCERQRQAQEQQRRCLEGCERQLEKRERQQGRGGRSREEYYEGESRQGRGGEENPYYFNQQRFRRHVTSQEGNIRVLERFSKRSDLLQGIDNYRVTLFESNPNTFEIPNHWDADSICVVLDGRGSVTILQQEKKETQNLERGDIFIIRAGDTAHIVNRDNNKKLHIAELNIPANTPGQFESFFAAGSQNQDSFFNAFSDEVLEAAFNVKRDQLRKLFEGQNKGGFVKASQEQIRALSGVSSSSEHGAWPFHRGGESQSSVRPHNLFKKGPSQSNQFGQFYEANPDDYEQLQEFDVSVTFANITRGGMLGPLYNSRATKVAVVVSGNGYFEMACPHLRQQGRQEGQQGRGSQERGQRGYQKVSARFSSGDVFVVPAGHPIVTVASNDENLQVMCFDINARNNQKYQLAGKTNMLKQLEKEAKKLSFNTEATEVDEIFNKQKESWFFPGPQQQKQHGGRASA